MNRFQIYYAVKRFNEITPRPLLTTYNALDDTITVAFDAHTETMQTVFQTRKTAIRLGLTELTNDTSDTLSTWTYQSQAVSIIDRIRRVFMI